MTSGGPRYVSLIAGGRRLRVAHWRLDDVPPDTRPLLIFNGIGINVELIAPLAKALGDRPIITFDMPGVGRSPDPVVPYNPATMALTARALLDRLGIERVDVLGISWGGGVAQQMALQHPARVGRLALAATSAGMVMAPPTVRTLARIADPFEYTMPRALQRNLAMLYYGGGRGPAVSLNAVKPASPTGWLYQLAALAGWTSVPVLPLLAVPTLVMTGDDDQVVPPLNARFLSTLIPGSRLRVFRGAGHLFMLSRLDAFAAELSAFLDEEPATEIAAAA